VVTTLRNKLQLPVIAVMWSGSYNWKLMLRGFSLPLPPLRQHKHKQHTQTQTQRKQAQHAAPSTTCDPQQYASTPTSNSAMTVIRTQTFSSWRT
jgi:hypothetical protein